MVSPSTASFSTLSHMLRYIYAISRFHRKFSMFPILARNGSLLRLFG